jgi:hypothetical protein
LAFTPRPPLLFAGPTHVLRCNAQSLKFLYNETLENNINYELGIEEVFYKSLSLNELKTENNPEGVP